MNDITTLDSARAEPSRRNPYADNLFAPRLSRYEQVAPLARQLDVLVVDDHRPAAEELARLVAGWGHFVRVAYDAVTAMRAVSRLQPHVVVVQLDPEQGGLELAETLRCWFPVAGMLLIGIASQQRTKRCKPAGGCPLDATLPAPVDPCLLETLLILELVRINFGAPSAPAELAHSLVLRARRWAPPLEQ